MTSQQQIPQNIIAVKLRLASFGVQNLQGTVNLSTRKLLWQKLEDTTGHSKLSSGDDKPRYSAICKFVAKSGANEYCSLLVQSSLESGGELWATPLWKPRTATSRKVVDHQRRLLLGITGAGRLAGSGAFSGITSRSRSSGVFEPFQGISGRRSLLVQLLGRHGFLLGRRRRTTTIGIGMQIGLHC